MKINKNNRECFLVTGASSGLGREFARILSLKYGADIVVSARRTERLEELKAEIERESKSRVYLFKADLSVEKDVTELFDFSCEKGVLGVINNAGMTFYGKTELSEIDVYKKMASLNFNAPLTLTLLFLDYFKKSGGGKIMNVASAAALLPVPYQNVYAATKQALMNFTLGVREEHKNSGVDVKVYMPGGINTEMYTDSGLEKKFGKKNMANMSAERAAQLGLKFFFTKKSFCIPGILNKFTALLIKLLPLKLCIKGAGFLYRPK